jgi:hypothetical protein
MGNLLTVRRGNDSSQPELSWQTEGKRSFRMGSKATQFLHFDQPIFCIGQNVGDLKSLTL